MKEKLKQAWVFANTYPVFVSYTIGAILVSINDDRPMTSLGVFAIVGAVGMALGRLFKRDGDYF